VTASGLDAPLAGNLQLGERLDARLRIEADGSITALTGKVELGQGIHAALAQIVADELDVPFDRVRVAPVDTSSSPNEGTTAASRSIEESGAALRQVAAEVRQALLESAAAELGVPIGELSVDAGVISAPDGRSIRYASLAGIDLTRPVTGQVKPKPARLRSLIGRSAPRRDLVAKVTGKPSYVQDLEIPGMVHARVVRPPSYGAELRSVEVDALSAMPGVVQVVCDGNFLAVIAEQERQAIAALTRARRTSVWDTGRSEPLKVDPRALLEMSSETALVEQRSDGAGPSGRVTSLEAEYSRQHIAHAAVGPSCAVAVLDDGGYTVWTHSQGIFELRHELANVLGMPSENVRVIHMEGAGCYGHNGADDAALDAALLARSVPGRAVRVQWARDDEFAWEPFGPAQVVRLSAGLDERGAIVDWQHDGWSPGHDGRPAEDRPAEESALLAAHDLAVRRRRPRPRSRLEANGGRRNAIPLYVFPNYRIVDHYVAEAAVRVSALRSLGAHLNVFAIESFMDEIATATGADPIELRLRYLVDARARAVVEAVADRARATPFQTGDGDHVRGRGIGFARYKNHAAYAAAMVEVDVGTEVTVKRAWGAIDAGMVVSREGLVNQAEGGITQAVSWALYEAVQADGSRIATRGWNT